MTKFKILEIIIRFQNSSFDVIQLELIRAFPDLSWDLIKSYLELLNYEGFIKIAYADNEIFDVVICRGTLARLHEIQETSTDNNLKSLAKSAFELLKLALHHPLL